MSRKTASFLTILIFCATIRVWLIPTGGILKSGSDVTDARWIPLNEVENYDLTESFRLFFLKHQKELKENARAF